MKKLLLSAMVLSACLNHANAQTRMTLHEEFTGENCPPCASTNPGFWALCNSNASKLIHITYLCPIPSAGPFYNTTIPNPMLVARANYYTVPFAPFGRYDGVIPNASATYPGHPTYFTQSDIDAEAAIPSPFAITATHYFNTAKDSVFGKVIVKAVSAVSSTQLKLRAAFCKSMFFTSSPGTNGEEDYENVVRAMFPDATGQAIAASWAVNAQVIYTYKGKIKGLETLTNYSTPDSMFVVWVQDDADKKVKQAAKSTYAPVGINETIPSVSNINIFPNPASNFINVRCILENPLQTNITITNSVGQVVLEKEFASSQKAFNENIALNNVSNGVYFITISNNGDKVSRQFSVVK
jgi:hypothetical protein